MSSGGHRGFTVVTIVTLIFAPFFAHHHWFYNLVSANTETHTVMCGVRQPCPDRQFVVNVVKPDLPTTPPPGQSGQDDSQQQHQHGG